MRARFFQAIKNGGMTGFRNRNNKTIAQGCLNCLGLVNQHLVTRDAAHADAYLTSSRLETTSDILR